MDSSTSGDFSFFADDGDEDQRLDAVVAHHIAQCSRTRAAALIRQGFIYLNQRHVKPSQRVHSGEAISGRIPPPEPVDIVPESIDLDILYQDDAILVINKPAGMVVHPAPGHASGTLVHGLLYHFPDLFSVGGQLRPGIVHRLDKETSGCLVVALNDSVHENLSRQFKARTTVKEYLALVHGQLATDTGRMDDPIGRHPVARKKMAINGLHARTALTRWEVKARFSSATLLKIQIKTGRTHQIRVHLNAAGHPVVGDSVYGPRRTTGTLVISSNKQVSISRQMLHAQHLGFEHPTVGKKVTFCAPVPDDMAQLIDTLKLYLTT